MTKKRLGRLRLDSTPLAVLGQKAGFRTAVERAHAAGISVHTLRHLERGSFMPGPEIIDMLAKAYKREPRDIEAAAATTHEKLLKRELERARQSR